ARRADMPIAAIAGITEAKAADVIAAGADGICVVSALFSNTDPQAAASRLRARVDTALNARSSVDPKEAS
ncbi:MAG: thiamine phosphate synthase, partial [Pseudomonadota bacterium]